MWFADEWYFPTTLYCWVLTYVLAYRNVLFTPKVSLELKTNCVRDLRVC